MFADVVFEKKNYDLPKILHSKGSKIYPELEGEILNRLKEDYQSTTEVIENKIGDQRMANMLSTHSKIANSLDKSSDNVSNYIQFLELMNIVKERFTEDDDVTSRIDLKQCYEYHLNNEFIQQLFNHVRKVDNYDELIDEIKSNMFVINSSDFDHEILLNVIKSLLYKLSQSYSVETERDKI